MKLEFTRKMDRMVFTISVILLQKKTYHIHSSFRKNENEFLAPLNNLWTLETDEPSGDDRTGYRDVESVFQKI